jgi:hypothetical protein
MRTLCIAAVVAACVLGPGAAAGQPAVGQIGMYFDGAGTLASRTIVPFESFTTYVVVHVPDDLSLFEFSLEVPPGITVTGATGGPPLCIGPGCGPIDWQTGPVECLSGGSPMVLVTVQAVALASPVGVDLPFCVERLSWSELDTPGYRTCTNELKPLALAPSPYGNTYLGCALANPTVLTAPAASWGSVKGRFSN